MITMLGYRQFQKLFKILGKHRISTMEQLNFIEKRGDLI